VLFTDARGFTEMSQDMEPEAAFDILNGHLAAQVDLVYKHGGYIDKYSGDGIMAVFDGEKMAGDACLCALAILQKTREFADIHGARTIRLGLGINKGEVTIGNLGSGEHLDYTVIGRNVNLAARLCGIASQSVVVAKSVRDAAQGTPGIAFSSERAVAVRGIREPVTVYDLQRTS
jgi:adenylate cyclase